MSRLFGIFFFSILISVAIYAFSFAGWTEPVRISEPGGCLYPQILAHGDTLHVVYSNNTGGTKISYVRSTDGGLTWSEHSVLSDTINTNNTVFARIIKYGSKLIVIWRAYFTSGGLRLNLGYSLSYNNGRSWSGPDYILHPNWAHILYFSSSGSGPVVNVILSSRINHELIFFDIRSTDFGRSWSEPAEIFRAAQSSLTDQTQIGDNLHFSWAGRFVWEGVWETYYMRSTDNGMTWSDNLMLSEDDQEISEEPAICADEAGNVACTWLDFKYSPYPTTGDILIRQSFDQGENWQSEDHVTSEHTAFKSDVYWIDDSLIVAWEDWRFGLPTIYCACSSDTIHDWSNKQRLEDDPEDSDNPAIAASNGKFYVVWADDRCDPDTDICGGVYFARYEVETSIEDRIAHLPQSISLSTYPNPFNSRAFITLNLAKGGEIELRLFDLNGKLVKTLLQGAVTDGQHKFTWDAVDASGNKVSSGIYFIRATGRAGAQTIKLVYLK